MHRAGTVDALVGVRAERVALGLGQALRQAARMRYESKYPSADVCASIGNAGIGGARDVRRQPACAA